jgi:hypothetical protein
LSARRYRHCEAEGRDPATIRKTILGGSGPIGDRLAQISGDSRCGQHPVLAIPGLPVRG